MRTDTERLNWLIDATETQSYDASERLQAAFILGLSGRTALDAAMGAKLIEPGKPMPELTALDLAVAELGRIRSVKGFSEEMDDTQINEQLVRAAVTYITPAEDRCDGGGGPDTWPWQAGYFKPSPGNRKRELTKGIALALCELDRLIRAERRQESNSARSEHEQESRLPDTGEPEAPREFKIGDRVRVRSNAQDNRFGWADWLGGFVGQTYSINEVLPQTKYTPIGYRIDGWVFPAEQLEHADD